MGLLKGLVTLPLAPVRGVVWIADRLAQAADEELHGEATTRRRLDELQASWDLGEISDEEFERAERELIGQLLEARRRGRP